VFDLKERNKEERKIQKLINELGQIFDQNSFFDFRIFFSSLFLSFKSNTP
jgi:hypothetical protein